MPCAMALGAAAVAATRTKPAMAERSRLNRWFTSGTSTGVLTRRAVADGSYRRKNAIHGSDAINFSIVVGIVASAESLLAPFIVVSLVTVTIAPTGRARLANFGSVSSRVSPVAPQGAWWLLQTVTPR